MASLDLGAIHKPDLVRHLRLNLNFDTISRLKSRLQKQSRALREQTYAKNTELTKPLNCC